jgi:hypothetical protein
MSTWLLFVFMLPVFFGRDFFLLRMGPRFRTAKRLRIYGLVLAASATLFPAFWRAGLDRAVLPMIVIYGTLCAISVWIRKTDRHNLAWLIAAAPNPVLVLGLAMLVQPGLAQGSAQASVPGPILAACVWIGLMTFCVKQVEDTPMDVTDLDLAVVIAAVVNSAALLILSGQELADASSGWADLFRQVTGMISAD